MAGCVLLLSPGLIQYICDHSSQLRACLRLFAVNGESDRKDKAPRHSAWKSTSPTVDCEGRSKGRLLVLFSSVIRRFSEASSDFLEMVVGPTKC